MAFIDKQQRTSLTEHKPTPLQPNHYMRGNRGNTHTHTHTHTQEAYLYTRISTRTHTDTHTHTEIHTQKPIYKHTRTHTHTHTHSHTNSRDGNTNSRDKHFSVRQGRGAEQKRRDSRWTWSRNPRNEGDCRSR